MSTPAKKKKNTTNDLPSSDRPYHNLEADEIVCDGYAPLLATACRYLTFLLFSYPVPLAMTMCRSQFTSSETC